MVQRTSGLFFAAFLMSMCRSAHSFESLRGPTFLNSSDADVDVSVVGDDGKTQQLLHAFPAHQTIAIPRELPVQSVFVVAGPRRYELGAREYTAQSQALLQRRQLWVFDGARICVVNISLLKSMSRNHACAGEDALR